MKVLVFHFFYIISTFFSKKKKKSYENNPISKELYFYIFINKLMIISFQAFLPTCRNTWVYDKLVEKYQYWPSLIFAVAETNKFKTMTQVEKQTSTNENCQKFMMTLLYTTTSFGEMWVNQCSIERYLHKQPKSSVWFGPHEF